MRAAALTLLALASVAMSACESTQDKSARLKREGKGLLTHEKGLELTRTNTDVKILDTALLHDQYGTAAVVELENETKRDVANVPVAITVKGAAGKTVYRNNIPGLEPALVSAPLMPHGKRVVWIHNQISAAVSPRSVAVKVGTPKTPRVPARLPDIELSKIRSDSDTDGAYVAGVIANRSKIAQKRLTIFCVARKGGRIVAAGRGVIDRLTPAPTKKPVRFKIYFIGNPKVARLGFYAPPSPLS